METLKSSTEPPTTPQRKRSSPKDIQVGEQRVRENGKEIYLAALDREYIIFCQIYSNAPLCLEAMYVNISIYISWDCSYFFASINSEDGERGVTFRVGKFIGQVSIESERLSREKRAVVVVDISRREVPPAALVVPVDLPADVHHRPLHLLAHRQQGQ